VKRSEHVMDPEARLDVLEAQVAALEAQVAALEAKVASATVVDLTELNGLVGTMSGGTQTLADVLEPVCELHFWPGRQVSNKLRLATSP
jgi:prefoldin subunit 5